MDLDTMKVLLLPILSKPQSPNIISHTWSGFQRKAYTTSTNVPLKHTSLHTNTHRLKAAPYTRRGGCKGLSMTGLEKSAVCVNSTCGTAQPRFIEGHLFLPLKCIQLEKTKFSIGCCIDPAHITDD